MMNLGMLLSGQMPGAPAAPQRPDFGHGMGARPMDWHNQMQDYRSDRRDWRGDMRDWLHQNMGGDAPNTQFPLNPMSGDGALGLGALLASRYQGQPGLNPGY